MSKRIFVIQPDYDNSIGVDLRLLGAQFWWGQQLKVLGFETMSGWATLPDARGKKTLGFAKPTQHWIGETLRGTGCRLALVGEFSTRPARLGEDGNVLTLAGAQLYELSEGEVRPAATRIEVESDNIPAGAHAVVKGCAERLGGLAYPDDWTEVFGTSEVEQASNYLTLLGCFSSCDMGIQMADADPVLRMAIAGIVHDVRPTIELFPALVASLEATDSTPDGMLEAAVWAAAGYVKPSAPAQWRDMLAQYGALRPRLLH